MNTAKNYRRASRLALVVAMTGNFLALPLAGQVATYVYTDLNPSGFTESAGYGISGSQQIGYGAATGDNQHALLWSGNSSNLVDLNPTGFTTSLGYGISGSRQVGNGSGSATGNNTHALLWSGTASSVVDLNPHGFTWSLARAASGSQQIGYGYGPGTGSNTHALLWSGTASTVVDLNPTGFTQSFGERIYGTQQVGKGSGPGTGNNDHALLWSGRASSVVDLNPSGFTSSGALGISGNQQVGHGSGSGTGNNDHALLWSGTASGVVDLNPSGFTTSVASGISGSRQVGYGSGSATGNEAHALLWSGTASSVVDLHSFLSSDYNFSIAEGIDANGNVFGFANYVPTGHTHAMLWIIIPGPEHAIYKVAEHVAYFGNSNITSGTISGFAVFEPDTGRGTSIAGFVVNNQKVFEVVPLQNYKVAHVTGPNGTSYSILAKAESPGTQFAGTVLESVYYRGRDSSVTIGPTGPRLLARTLVSSQRTITHNDQTEMGFGLRATLQE